MRFSFSWKFDAVLIGGRSFTYISTNDQVMAPLQCIRRVLVPKGILIFDNFDAAGIFKDLSKPLRDEIRIGAKTITRTSERSMNLKTGWTWNWDAVYVIQEGRKKETLEDHSVLRAFTRDELQLFLALNWFTPIRFRRTPATILTVARLT